MEDILHKGTLHKDTLHRATLLKKADTLLNKAATLPKKADTLPRDTLLSKVATLPSKAAQNLVTRAFSQVLLMGLLLAGVMEVVMATPNSMEATPLSNMEATPNSTEVTLHKDTPVNMVLPMEGIVAVE